MKIVTTPTIEGHKITRALGVVSGSTVRAKNVGRDIITAFKNLVGGEITEYTQLLGQSRKETLSIMIAKAEDMDANAVINLRFMTSMVSQAVSEIYGTAAVTKVE